MASTTEQRKEELTSSTRIAAEVILGLGCFVAVLTGGLFCWTNNWGGVEHASNDRSSRNRFSSLTRNGQRMNQRRGGGQHLHPVFRIVSQASSTGELGQPHFFIRLSLVFPLLPQYEGNACVEVTQGQSFERRTFPELCSRLCDVPLPTTSTGNAYLFRPLLRPPIQISRCGLSALPREMNLSGI